MIFIIFYHRIFSISRLFSVSKVANNSFLLCRRAIKFVPYKERISKLLLSYFKDIKAETEMKNRTIFLTGGTGFIGKELLKGLLKDGHTIYLLIRSNKNMNAENRFEDLCGEIGIVDSKHSVHLVKGDLSLKRFGLNENQFNKLSVSIDTIYHAAASVQLNAPIDILREINVKGTQTVLDLAMLAKKSGFSRLNYISTAYVAGKRSGTIVENELDCQQTFNNSYELAKFEAELLVEKAKQSLPICIYRPSMVMGHSQTGWTSAFNVLYGPIKMGYLGNLPFVPGCKRSKIDIVPIDYVSNAILHLSNLDGRVNGKTFHISAGLNKSVSAKELLELAYKHLSNLVKEFRLENPMARPQMVHPEIFKGLAEILYHTAKGERKEKIRKLLTYVNYTLFYKEFDSSEAEKYLSKAGIVAPRFQDYAEVICRYAVSKHFGKANTPQNVYSKSKISKKEQSIYHKKISATGLVIR